ncbi:MAG: hypothetical protein LEGION0398_MBIBDBAK_01086 [Legionellaceae bacterium]
MIEPSGKKIMIDLHGLKVQEVKKLINERFAEAEKHEIGEIYLITGKGNHVNSNGSRGVLKKILPKLLKPYSQDILQVNPEEGAYKIILKPKQPLVGLKDALVQVFSDEMNLSNYINYLENEAKSDDPKALVVLGFFYLHNVIQDKDNVSKGIHLLEKAKQLGSLDAIVELGILYHEGLVLKQEHKKAYKYFSDAAQKGHAIGQFHLGLCYYHGKGVKYDDQKTVYWIKKSADQGDVYAQYALGDFYLMGEITDKNEELGIFYKKKAAEQGLAIAQIDLARCYATGYGVERNDKVAFDYYLSAADSNKSYAIYQVGSYLLTGRSGIPRNPILAFPWFLKAAELQDGDGQAQTAYLYLIGIGTEKNLSEGIKWALEAVKQKNAHGYYVIAMAYLKGLGITQNGALAYKYMKLSAENGYVDAQYELGILLLEGNRFLTDIPHEPKEGLCWLENAREQGQKAATVLILLKETAEENIFSEYVLNKVNALFDNPELINSEKTSTSEVIDNISSQEDGEHSSRDTSEFLTNTIDKKVLSSFSFFAGNKEKDVDVAFTDEEIPSSNKWCTIA